MLKLTVDYRQFSAIRSKILVKPRQICVKDKKICEEDKETGLVDRGDNLNYEPGKGYLLVRDISHSGSCGIFAITIPTKSGNRSC